MNDAAQQFFDQLMSSPGVSGYEQPVQAVVRDYAQRFAHRVSTDLHGNVIAALNPDAPVRIMFAGHCDQLGLVVSWVDEQGFLFFQTVGGWDSQQLVGREVTVWTDDGPLPGVISRKAIHLQTEDERKQVAQLKDLWIDIGARDRESYATARTVNRSPMKSIIRPPSPCL